MLYSLDNPKRRGAGIPKYTGTGAASALPFSILVTSVNAGLQNAKVRVNKYSALLESPDILDAVDLIGTNYLFDIKYGDKIWLEVFYDKHLVPVFSKINYGTRWTATVKNLLETDEDVSVYPQQLEFITRLDLADKLDVLEGIVDGLAEMEFNTLNFLEQQFTLGYLTATELAGERTLVTEKYEEYTEKITAFKDDFNQFFSFEASGLNKKLFRSYTMLAYTTKDFEGSLEGDTVVVPIVVTDPAPAIPQASENKNFKIVPCVKTNLLLMDICFNNAFPAKLPMPYHSPVFEFINDEGFGEEEENAAI